MNVGCNCKEMTGSSVSIPKIFKAIYSVMHRRANHVSSVISYKRTHILSSTQVQLAAANHVDLLCSTIVAFMYLEVLNLPEIPKLTRNPDFDPVQHSSDEFKKGI